MTIPSESSFRKDINGLRAVAVVLVVLYHVGPDRVGGGFVGVDVFFVISGFLMTRIIASGLRIQAFSYAGFMWSRFKRIVPALAVVVCSLLLAGWFFVEPMSYAQMAQASAASLVFFSNFLYLSQASYFAATSAQNWLLHTWSLSVEWQFYLLYPWFLTAILRFRRPELLLPVLAAVSLLSFSGCIWLSSVHPLWGFYMLPSRAWELTAGGVICVFPPRPPSNPVRLASLEAAGILLIAASALLFTKQLHWTSYWAAVPVVGAMAVLFADRGDDSFLASPLVQFIGRTSYSIYLWHWPLIVAIRYSGFSTRWWAPPVAITLALAFGWLSFTFVERPMDEFLQKLRGNRRRFVAIGLPVGCVLLALVIARDQGIPARAHGDRVVADSINARMQWEFPTSSCEGFYSNGTIKTCHAGGDARAGTLVIGDSEAQEWYPRYAYRSMARYLDASVTFATRAGCFPSPGFERAEPGHRCGAFADQAFALAESGDFERVVLIAAWEEYLGDPTSHDVALALCRRETAGCDPARDHQKMLSDVQDALSVQLQRLHARGIPVVIVLPIPVPGFDLPQAIASHAFAPELAKDHLAVNVDDYLSDNRDSREILANVARRGSASILDPIRFMCNTTICPLVDDHGMSLYKDSVHLRPSAVRTRFDFLDRAVVH